MMYVRFAATSASDYLVNFATSGDPNGGGLPRWDAATGAGGYAYLHVDTDASCKMEQIDPAEMDLMAESFGLGS